MNTTPKQRDEAAIAVTEAIQRGHCAKEVVRLSGVAFGLAVDYYTELDQTINPEHRAAFCENRIRELEAALETSRALCESIRSRCDQLEREKEERQRHSFTLPSA